MTEEQERMLAEVHEWMKKIRGDLYSERPLDGKTLIERLACLSDNAESIVRAVRWLLWIGGAISGAVMIWAEFKEKAIRLLGGQP